MTHLQGVTRTLVAVRTQEEVFDVVLRDALDALGALGGAVLLVKDKAYSVAARRGYADASVWQDGDLDAHLPGSDALRSNTPLFFSHHGDLTAAYPELEVQTSGVAAVATAVLPMLEGGRPLGVIILDFKEPHDFTSDEEHFLLTLAAQCAVALGRAEATRTLEARVEERTRQLAGRTRQLEEERAALEAFAAFTEAVGIRTDLVELVEQAVQVLVGRFPGASVAFYELESDLWKARIWSEDVSSELVALVSAGLPARTPIFAQVLQTRQPVFTDAWDAQREQVTSSEDYAAAALYPLIVDGQLHWLLTVGLRNTPAWSEADKGLLRAVGRGLNLALERRETAQQLTLQNAELQARTQALEAFAELTRDLALTTNPLLLIQRAQEVVLSMLTDGASMFYVLEGDRWFNRVQHGNLHSPELQASIDAGLPYAESSNLVVPWTTGQPYFQDVYDHHTDDLAPDMVSHIGATATLLVHRGDKPLGVLAIALFHQRAWSSVDRVVLETAVHSLELALDRAAKTRRIEEERAALEAFTRFTEAVGSETDVQVLVRQAITLLQETCEVEAAYFKREGELFKVTAWTPSADPALIPALQQGFRLQYSGIAQVLLQNTAAFIDHWKDTGLLIEESGIYQAVAGYPYFVAGELESVLMIGSRTSAIWAERDREIFQAVGRSLNLALERSEQARRLEEQNTELSAQTLALEGAAELTRDLTLPGGQQQLIGQVMDLVLSLLPPGYAAYWEIKGEQWRVTAHRGDVGRPEWQAARERGLPVGQLPTLDRPWQTRQPYFQGHYDPVQDAVPDLTGHLLSVATLPVMVRGEVVGIFAIGLFGHREWSAADQALLKTAVQSLGLALDRAAQAHELTVQRDLLKASTEELEAFSYSVSHDLRTPVRHMLGFLRLARTALGSKLDERSARYLDVVEQAGTQMNTLIDALLDLSNAAQQPLRPRMVDLNELMEEIRNAVLPDLLTRNVQWQVMTLPSVQGDWDALKQVLTQLTENALKFTRTRDPAIIRIWAEDQGQVWGVFVQDNGLGFDPQYQGRLFNVFQRLHSVQEVPGTGVGLASIRRLILKHGGQVFAEGQVNQGATFGFTLPKGGPILQLTGRRGGT